MFRLRGPSERAHAIASDAIVGTGLAVVAVGFVFAALVVIGFAIVVRRNRATLRTTALVVGDQGVRADIALVRLDDLVAECRDELAFAEAQFGGDQTSALAEALSSALSNLTSAFGLKQQLDDATPDSASRIREWNARILMLCETATERLTAERSVLDGLRSLERAAPGQLSVLRRSLADTRARLPRAESTARSLRSGFAGAAIESVMAVPGDAERLLDSAASSLDEAESAVDGETFASGHLDHAGTNIERADRLLDELDGRARALAESSDRLDDLLRTTRSALVTARIERDAPPDPLTGAAIGDAISALERAAVAARPEGTLVDPDAARTRIEAAADALDGALAGARNQDQRLAHAAHALAGALLTARSQLATTSAYISASHGSAGAEARTRLAEAKRLLTLAEAESDPVIALDTARSSATYSRDADALARYDQLS